MLSDACDPKPVFELWENNWGFPNGIAQQDLTEWVNQFGTDLVVHAIEFALRRNISAKGADRYLAKTFERYASRGIKTVKQAKEQEENHRKQMSREFNGGSKTIRREPVPGWLRKEQGQKQGTPEPPAHEAYVMPDDSMDPMPK